MLNWLTASVLCSSIVRTIVSLTWVAPPTGKYAQPYRTDSEKFSKWKKNKKIALIVHVTTFRYCAPYIATGEYIYACNAVQIGRIASSPFAATDAIYLGAWQLRLSHGHWYNCCWLGAQNHRIISAGKTHQYYTFVYRGVRCLSSNDNELWRVCGQARLRFVPKYSELFVGISQASTWLLRETQLLCMRCAVLFGTEKFKAAERTTQTYWADGTPVARIMHEKRTVNGHRNSNSCTIHIGTIIYTSAIRKTHCKADEEYIFIYFKRERKKKIGAI